MTKAQFQMTKETPNTNDRSPPDEAEGLTFGFGHSFGFGHLSLVIVRPFAA